MSPRRFASVSILARPEGRALRNKAAATFRLLVFQSSPAPKDGRYKWSQGGSVGNLKSFNPRPPRRTGATVTLVSEGVRSLFQSSPAPKDGRYPESCDGYDLL